MSNSTTLLDTIATNQSNKEVVANALFDAVSPATLWGRHASACNGLTWGYYGGFYNGNAIVNGTLTLTASATNYVYANGTTGAVSVNATGFPAGAVVPLYTIVTGATTVTSYTDERAYIPVGARELPGAIPYDMLGYIPGVPQGGQVLLRSTIPRTITLPANLTGSYASSLVGATAATTLTIAKNGTTIGSVNFAASANTGTFMFSGAVTFNAGDLLTVTNQPTADTTLSGISITFAATR